VLYDHDVKVSGDSARFADFLAAGGRQLWAVCVLKNWADWAIAAPLRTREVTRPAGGGLGTMLNAMPFSADRCTGP
jgi:hypothetical protein